MKRLHIGKGLKKERECGNEHKYRWITENQEYCETEYDNYEKWKIKTEYKKTATGREQTDIPVQYLCNLPVKMHQDQLCYCW